MSGVHDWTALIDEERSRWSRLPWTSEGVGSYRFNHILSENASNIVRNMHDIIKAVDVRRCNSLGEVDGHRKLSLGCKHRLRR